MSIVETTGGLRQYLEHDLKAIEESYEHWAPEFQAFVRLSEIYQVLVATVVVVDEKHYIPGAHLLVVESQMYGVVSELLRRRPIDAQVLTRRAIEAAATAYRVWKYPELLPVFKDAYPNFLDQNHPGRWKPSARYRQEFSTFKLFGEPGDTWKSMKTLYEVLSAKSSHTGPGATIPHVTKEGACHLSFREKDDIEIRRCWYAVLTAFWNCLKVFLAMMRDTGKPAMISVIEEDMKKWQAQIAKQIDERAYWMKDKNTSAAQSDFIIIPSM